METVQADPFADLAPSAMNVGPRVVVIGHDRAENTGPIYTALDRVGCRVVGTGEYVGSVDLSKTRPDVIVVRGDMVPRDREPGLLAALIGPWKLVVLLGASRRDKAEPLTKLPDVTVERVLIVPPYDFQFLVPGRVVAVASVQSSGNLSHRPSQVPASAPIATASAAPALPAAVIVNPGLMPPDAVRRRIRLGLYGTRGGVGVSTAALKVAQWLVEDSRVILIDAAKRGDLHLLLGVTPGARHSVGNLTLVSDTPSEALVAGYDVIIIDGGRQRGAAFNAQWVEVRKPLKDDELRSLIGLPSGVNSPPRAFSLGRLFSVRITE